MKRVSVKDLLTAADWLESYFPNDEEEAEIAAALRRDATRLTAEADRRALRADRAKALREASGTSKNPARE